MNGRILVINTGSTSSKIGFYDSGEKLFETNLTHTAEEIARYDSVMDQTPMRRDAITDFLSEKGIALEIQAGSPFPRPKFLKLAKSMGAKFSFGTNNFDPTPKDLSRWLEAIEWLDITPDDIWSPADNQPL